MTERNLRAIEAKAAMQEFYNKEIKAYNKSLLIEKDEDIKGLSKRTKELLETKRSLVIDALYHGGQLISAVAKNDPNQIKNESLQIFKKMTEGLTYYLSDKELALRNVPECVGTGVEWAEKNPRGEIEVLVCVSYVVSLLRDDNLVGNQVFSPNNYRAVVQLLETVLKDFNSSIADILKEK